MIFCDNLENCSFSRPAMELRGEDVWRSPPRRDPAKFSPQRVREGIRKKIRNYLGIFPKCRTPPLLGTPRPKKKIMVYFAF